MPHALLARSGVLWSNGAESGTRCHLLGPGKTFPLPRPGPVLTRVRVVLLGLRIEEAERLGYKMRRVFEVLEAPVDTHTDLGCWVSDYKPPGFK